jgi:hypothetical protein
MPLCLRRAWFTKILRVFEQGFDTKSHAFKGFC